MSRYYSNKELILRVLWGIAEVLIFRFTPRLLYGWRNAVLRIFGARIGKRVRIFPSARITYPWLLTIEDDVVISWHVRLYNLGPVTIGRRTIVSQYAHLCGGNHDYLVSEFTLLRTGLSIGNNVWIAADSFIGPGVHVGDNSVVGARAVVTSSVPQNALVAGNPAKVIRNITRPERG